VIEPIATTATKEKAPRKNFSEVDQVPEPNKIFVSNLTWTTSEEVCNVFISLYHKYNTILNI
jgi:hypothetical protein